jgi:hypothetical protein
MISLLKVFLSKSCAQSATLPYGLHVHPSHPPPLYQPNNILRVQERAHLRLNNINERERGIGSHSEYVHV